VEPEQGLDLAVGEVLARTLGDGNSSFGHPLAHRFQFAQGRYFPADRRHRIGLRRLQRNPMMVLVETQPHQVGTFVAALFGTDDAGREVAPGFDVRDLEDEIPKLADAHVLPPVWAVGLTSEFSRAVGVDTATMS
jgi:hypothetical protein